MAAGDLGVERRGLLASMAATAMLGALGVVWGIAIDSSVILLDGVYAVIGILLSWMLLRASLLARAEPTHRYPYGRESVTPLVIGFQGLVLLGTLVYAGVEAVATIRDGGSEITAGWALLYGVLTTVGSVAVWLWLRRRSGTSDVLVAEVAAWRVAAFGGVGMVVGFTIMGALSRSSWDGAAPYVDPVMVLVTCVAFAPTPLRLVRRTVVELLEGAPPASVQEPVLAAVAEVQAAFGLDPPEVLMSKVGPKLYVEVDAMVDPSVTVAEEQEVRQALQRRLDDLPYEVWLNIELLPRPTPPPAIH